jgi:hypothetical protein
VIRANATMSIRTFLLTAALLAVAAAASTAAAQAALPAWQVMGVTGPTHLSPAVDETQALTVAAGGGTFTLTFNGQTTGPLAYNVQPSGGVGPTASVENALNALSSIGGTGGSVSVAGGPGNPSGSNPYTLTFGGALGGLDVPAITVNIENLGVAPGAQLTCTGGPTGGTGATTVAYQWLSDGAPALGAGASTATYTVDATDTGKAVQCRVTATHTAGTAPTGSTQVSNPAIVVSPFAGLAPLAPATITAPAAPVGGFVAGNKLICTTGTWTGVTEPFGFQWYRNGIALVGNGANTSEYTLQAADISGAAAFQCAVTGSNDNGSVTKISANRNTTAPIAPSPTAPAATANSAGGPAASIATTTVGGATGQIVATVANVGGAASSGPVTLTVGPLPGGIKTSATPTGSGWSCNPTGAGQTAVTCEHAASIGVERMPRRLTVPVTIGPSASTSSTVPISVQGGGATSEGGDEHLMPVTVSAIPAPPGVEAMWAGAFDEDGQPYTQAGGHPARVGVFFRLNTVRSPSGEIVPAGDLRDVAVEAPPGFLGNPTVTAGRCPQDAPSREESSPGVFAQPVSCPLTAIVGRAEPMVQDFASTLGGNQAVFNNVPKFGYPAQFTFHYVTTGVTLVGSLRSDEDYGVTVTAPNVPLIYKAFGSFAILDGNPEGAEGKAFLTNPTNCAEQAQTMPVTALAVNTWQAPSLFDEQVDDLPPVTGCDKLDFEPDFTFQPSTAHAASATAATAHLHIDQARLLDPAKEAPPHLKRSVVTLPEGLTPNPAAADGLEACTTEQIGLIGTGFAMPNPIRFDKSSPRCPDAAKIGAAEIETPLLGETLHGTVYQAAQDDNPFGSLLALYVVIDDAKTGTTVKLPGEVKTDPQTGRLTVIFDNNPQIPFSDLRLHLRGGPRSILATPDVCGTHSTSGEWTPWSAPESGPPATTVDGFPISSGAGGSGCANSKAERPFALGLEAGATNPAAGAYSPFRLQLTRPDGSQEIDRVTVTTPPGFLASLKGVGICSQSAIDAAQAKSGKEELANPSCPSGSQVGTTTIGAGVGSSPFYLKTGKIYLSGPYKGGPASLTFIVPAVAGPFDLGVQVVKTALRVDPKTAQVTAESDPIPQILKGIPVLIRDIRVDLDRSNFALNPTNCEAMAITARITGGSGAVSNLQNRFQVGNCEALAFKPKLKIQLHGGTKRAAYQRLEATVTYPKGPGYANIARAAVTLPHSAFLAQEHIRTVCTRVQFAAKACPKGSVYGHATAITPLLDAPVTGPVYLRSSDNQLPDLVAALRGPDHQPIEVELAGRTDSKNGGIRNTFDLVPDAPVSKFTLKLKGGKKSLIVNSRNLCGGKQRASVRLKAHNGMQRNFRTVVGNDCEKKERKAGRSVAGDGGVQN